MSRERLFLSDEDDAAEPVNFGCSMLTATRYTSKSGRPVKVMRCSLGWALHSEIDVARCLATPLCSECWQQHPERAPAVMVPMADESIALPLLAMVAGD